ISHGDPSCRDHAIAAPVYPAIAPLVAPFRDRSDDAGGCATAGPARPSPCTYLAVLALLAAPRFSKGSLMKPVLLPVLRAALASIACSADDAARPSVDEQCRSACLARAPAECQAQCVSKCRGPCLSAPTDLPFDFAATTTITCAPADGAVSFAI